MNKCPDCGSPQLCKELYDGSVSYQFDCGSVARAEIGVVWPSVSCLLRQLAQRTQERDEARAAFDSSAEFGAIETKRADEAEAQMERIRVALSRYLKSEDRPQYVAATLALFKVCDAEFGKDGW